MPEPDPLGPEPTVIETGYIVIRGTGDFMFDGRWYQFPLPAVPPGDIHYLTGLTVTLHATDEVEQRPDGARATVFRPDVRT